MSLLLILSLSACVSSGEDAELEEGNEEQQEPQEPNEENSEGDDIEEGTEGQNQPEQPQEIGTDLDDDDAMVVINGEEILKEEFTKEFERTKVMVSAQYGIDLEDEENEALIPQLQQQTMQNLVSQTVLLQEAENQDLNPSEEEIESNLEELKEQLGGEEGYQEALEEDNLTEEDLKDMLSQEAKISQVIENNVDFDSIEVTEEDIENYYEQYTAQMEEQQQEAPPLEAIKEDLKAQIKQQKTQEIEQVYVQNLMDESDIEILY